MRRARILVLMLAALGAGAGAGHLRRQEVRLLTPPALGHCPPRNTLR
jgi:hypothetical protein